MPFDATVESKYFLDALELFHETQWLYEYPVTEILIRKSLEEFPEGWLTNLMMLDNSELNELVVNRITKRDWPESLLSFVKKSRELDRLPPHPICTTLDNDVKTLTQSFKTGLSAKKQHEIIRLADLVHAQCSKNQIKTVVDLGAGLGYICQLLHHRYGYRVIGLESNPKNVETSKRRQKELYPSSIPHVSYICTKINLDSTHEISSYLKDEEFCLIGLHACADLGVDACKLFEKISSAKILILLSCCYHKLDVTDKGFRNFPVSETLNKTIETYVGSHRELSRPFLRLACQETAERWKEMSEDTHLQHSFHVLARAVLELWSHEHSTTLKKRVQKATRKSQCRDFETYLKDSLVRYEFFRDDDEPIEIEKIRQEILTTWDKNGDKLRAAEIYTGLQLMLQSVAESFVLNDRRCWLLERNFETQIVSVTSRELSPRSHAIISKKN